MRLHDLFDQIIYFIYLFLKAVKWVLYIHFFTLPLKYYLPDVRDIILLTIIIIFYFSFLKRHFYFTFRKLP